ncbi:MFS transporter [Corynebacterium pyruviciproducens]|uniref:MFS transporter n=1 Tax=Corynebacterium pyruviciproducens TaxID=598660 RepID=A0AAF0YS51_9CORY|nr:MFS transporter [Corynebacterium pyruviciproducens]MDH4657378.1 MFS transporter [Corynebacterium pyruviciproducens]WOT01751.1 MFS transporter [Corynebacterium pyruviciproducens]
MGERKKILVVLLIPLAMALVAVSSINVALPSIEHGLGASASQLQWMLAGYALSFGVFLVPFGRLGDLLGRSTFFTIGLGLFCLSTALCGFASDPTILNVFRFIQGFAAAVYSPQTAGIIQTYFHGRDRARAFAMFGLTVAVAVAVGPVIAGSIISALDPSWGWRWSFWFMVPVGIIGIFLALRWLPFADEKAHRKKGRIDVDPVGALLLASTVVCIMYPFMYHGDNKFMWLLLPLALVLGICWVLWEKHYEKRGNEPMVNLGLLKLHSFGFGTAISGIMFMGSTSIFSTLAIYLQNGQHFSALSAGLVGLGGAVTSAITAYLSGNHSLEHGRAICISSLAAMVIGMVTAIAVIYFNGMHGLNIWWLFGSFAIVGLGQGAFGSANQTIAMLDVPPREGGTAGAFKQTAERVATAIGNAIMTGILFSVLATTNWNHAITTAFMAITVVVTVALVLQVLDYCKAKA